MTKVSRLFCCSRLFLFSHAITPLGVALVSHLRILAFILLTLATSLTAIGCGGDGAKGKNSGLDMPRPATAKQN